MTEQALAPLAVNGGGPAVAGGLSGYLAKKAVKILMAIVMAFFGILAYLEREGVIGSVDWEALNTMVMESLASVDPGSALAQAGLGGGLFSAGFVAGFYKG